MRHLGILAFAVALASPAQGTPKGRTRILLVAEADYGTSIREDDLSESTFILGVGVTALGGGPRWLTGVHVALGWPQVPSGSREKGALYGEVAWWNRFRIHHGRVGIAFDLGIGLTRYAARYEGPDEIPGGPTCWTCGQYSGENFGILGMPGLGLSAQVTRAVRIEGGIRIAGIFPTPVFDRHGFYAPELSVRVAFGLSYEL